MKWEKNLIIRLTQGLHKFKFKLLLKNITKKALLFLHYLWKIKIIYGYSFANNLKSNIFLFIKNTEYNINFFCFKKKYLSKKRLNQTRVWTKNTLHVIKTYNNYLTVSAYKRSFIGGYLFLTIF